MKKCKLITSLILGCVIAIPTVANAVSITPRSHCMLVSINNTSRYSATGKIYSNAADSSKGVSVNSKIVSNGTTLDSDSAFSYNNRSASTNATGDFSMRSVYVQNDYNISG